MTEKVTKAKEPKMLPSERRALKRREAAASAEKVFGTGRGSLEPVINPLDYTITLMHALNYYNSAYDNKDKRKWVMAYVGKNNTEFDSLPDYEFRSIGTMIRIKQRDQHLETKELNYIDERLEEMRQLAKTGRKVSSLKGGDVEKVEKPAVVTPTIDKDAVSASTHIAEINAMIDDFIMNDTEVDIASYLKSSNVTSGASKLIPSAFNRVMQEIAEAIKGEDKQLVEGYSNFKKVKLRRLLKLYESIGEACAQQAVSVKAARKPVVRKIKEKPVGVIVKSVKYMKEFPELGIKSESPIKLVGASEVWIYNTKYKKIQVYKAEGTEKLSVKGTTIIGYSVANSTAKTLRKPEVTKDFQSMTKKTFETAYKNIKTKDSPVNGRINEECIILKVFA